MKALGGRGIYEAPLRLSLGLVRVGPREGELGGDIMNMVGGGGGPVDTEKIGSSQGIGLGSVANVKLMQGFGLSTNGGMSSGDQAQNTRGQRSNGNTRKQGLAVEILRRWEVAFRHGPRNSHFSYTRWGTGRSEASGDPPTTIVCSVKGKRRPGMAIGGTGSGEGAEDRQSNARRRRIGLEGIGGTHSSRMCASEVKGR